ncbi:hypothetical protein M1349_05375 [Patescibacteria group bacterium]|nr:hypothetical protein [Patescibacteria group bacterium]
MANIIFFDIDDVLFKTDLFIESGFKKYEPYEDVKEVIKKIEKKSEIGILSQGDYNLQISKISNTDLFKLFKKENIFIVEEKNEIIRNIFKNFKDKVIYVIDDRTDNLSKIKKAYSKSKTILIKRGRHQNISNGYKPDFIISNLNEILKII